MQNCTYMRYQLVLLDIRSHLEQAWTLRCASQKPFLTHSSSLLFLEQSNKKKIWPFLQKSNPLWQFSAEGKNTTLPTLKDTASRPERTPHPDTSSVIIKHMKKNKARQSLEVHSICGVSSPAQPWFPASILSKAGHTYGWLSFPDQILIKPPLWLVVCKLLLEPIKQNIKIRIILITGCVFMHYFSWTTGE